MFGELIETLNGLKVAERLDTLEQDMRSMNRLLERVVGGVEELVRIEQDREDRETRKLEK